MNIFFIFYMALMVPTCYAKENVNLNSIISQIYKIKLDQYCNYRPKLNTQNNFREFRFGARIFNIPVDYLVGGSDIDSSNDHGFFVIEASLPNLCPLTDEMKRQFVESRNGFGDVVRITFNYNMHLIPTEALLKEIAPSAHTNIKDNYFLYKSYYQDIYVYRDGNGQADFLARCAQDRSPAPHKSCDVFEQFDDDSALYYFYDKKFIYNGFENDRKIRDLISSFIP